MWKQHLQNGSYPDYTVESIKSKNAYNSGTPETLETPVVERISTAVGSTATAET
jgi:hypothetical protein